MLENLGKSVLTSINYQDSSNLSSSFEFFGNSVDEANLHIASRKTLNIQVHTSSIERLDNRDHWNFPLACRNINNLRSLTRLSTLAPRKQLRFGIVNTRSIRNKTSDFIDHVLDNGIEICAVTETWLTDKDSVSIAALSPNGYSFANFPRPSSRSGGGTGVFFNNSFNVVLSNGGEKRSFEFSDWRLSAHGRIIKIIIIYRPPYSEAHPVPVSEFFQEFSTFMETTVLCPEVLLVTGDFNFHLDDDSDADAKKFMELLDTFGLQQHVITPTHMSGHLLDLVISRTSNDINVFSPQSSYFISDHCFIECLLSVPGPNIVFKEVSYRKLKQIDVDSFKSDIVSSALCNSHWSSLESISQCYDETLLQILDKHAPVNTKILTIRPRVPWFSPELKEQKGIRRRLERRMIRTKTQADKNAYRNACNSYSMLLRKSKRKYYTDLIGECGGNTRKLFQVVRSLSNKPDGNPLPPHDDPRKLADDFGEFFYRKIELIKKDIDGIAAEPPVVDYPSSQVLLESFVPLSQEQVSEIIMGMSNASCQLDPIPTWLLKQCSSELVPVITIMINRSFQESTVPKNWKVALVKPLLKKLGLDLVPENFRPVSNLSLVSKVVEKAVVNQLFNHCHENAPLPLYQSSYRPFHSTETALLKVQSDILSNMDNQEVTLLVLLDLSAAFDTIDRRIMLEILRSDFGVCGDALEWFRSYLSERKQHVIVDQQSSKIFNVNSGVPQGSCLGPVLFILYASRLFEVVKKHLPLVHGYADDTQLYVSFRPASTAAEDAAVKAMESCIDDVRAWLACNKLMCNDSKTELLIIGSRRQLSKISTNCIRVGNCDIKSQESVRNLGSWFDNHLSMSMHIGKVCSKAFRGLYNIRQIRKYLSEDSIKILIHAFVTSHLDYCNSLLYGLPQYQYDRLQKVLNAAARVTCYIPKFEHISPVLMRLHWLPIRYRVEYKIALLVFKALHGLAPVYITELIKAKPVTRYSLRSDSGKFLQVPSVRCKTFGERAFVHAGPTVWNALPLSLRICDNLNCFKKGLKTHLFVKAFN